MTYEIKLDKQHTALIDAADKEIISHHKWRSHSVGENIYARAIVWKNNKASTILMHRLVMSAEKGQVVDHINHDGLDNRRSNLRLCSVAENIRNQIKSHKRGSSRFKGVSLFKRSGQWHARIKFERHGIHLGYFVNEEDAARAYDAAASKFFGEFARLNFPA